MIKRLSVVALIGCLVWGAVPRCGLADLIIIGINAEVSHIDDRGLLVEGLLNIGDPITGTYTYDSDTPDGNPSESAGLYWHYNAPYGFELTAGPYVFQTDPDHTEFFINVGNGTWDGHVLVSYNNLPLSNGVPVDHISWQLDDYSGMALSSDALPLGPPILEDWEYDWGLRIELGPKGDTMVTADVTSVWLIPEPATVLLLGLGALALLRIRRRG